MLKIVSLGGVSRWGEARYVRARPCATNREESYPKKVTHGPKSLSRYNDIVVSHIAIKGFYWYFI